jgi:hypothetical protein
VTFKPTDAAGSASAILLAGLCLIATACPVQAQTAPSSATSWYGEVGIGGEYDTNVSVDEVDISSGQSDYALIADLELGVQHKFTARTQGSLTYDVSQSVYREFSRVNRLTQIIGADLSTQLESASAGLSAYYIDAQLDGEAFLRYSRISPSVSGFVSQRWFGRGAYVYAERKIDQRARRNATTQAGEVDFYYFHRGLRSYANLGYRYRDEDAVAPELDFRAHALKLRYIRRVDFFDRKAKVEVAMRYEVRDYLAEEPTIQERRDDNRLRWQLDFEVPLSERFTVQAYFSYGDYQSNLPRADFTQTIIGSRLQYAW